MKEQVLHLDPHDDFNSARDKLGWAQTARVLLVWPPRGRVLARRLDLLLLARHAGRLGAHLALITNDPLVREHARTVGLPVFASIDASRRGPWRSRTPRRPKVSGRPRLDPATVRPARRARWPALPAWVGWAFKIAIFALGLGGFAVLAIALMPSATVTVTPASHALVADLEVIADPAAQSVAGDRIPARVVRVEVEASGRTTTTGRLEVPSQPATGSVVFTSLDGVATTIPAGTGLRTTSGTPARFRTMRATSIDGRIGATAIADIQAVDLGPAGNVAPGQINAIDGPLGLQLAVTNAAPTQGGARAEQASVTADDHARIRAELTAQLQGAGLEAIQGQLVPGEFLAAGSVVPAGTVAETFEFAVGEPSAVDNLTLRLAFTGQAIAETDARQVALATLGGQVPPGEALLPGSERYERQPETTTSADGLTLIGVRIEGVAVPQVDAAEVRQLVKGQPVPQAQLHLVSALPLAGLPRVEVWPDWYPRLPWMPFRIKVAVDGT